MGPLRAAPVAVALALVLLMGPAGAGALGDAAPAPAPAPQPGAPGLLDAATTVRAAADAAAPDGDALPRAVRAAHAATLAQAGLLGLALPEPAPVEPRGDPSAHAGALLARHGVVPDAAQRDAVERLDALPPAARAALARFLAAHLAFEDAAFTAFDRADPATLATFAPPRAPGEARPSLREAGVDLGPVLAARGALLDAAAGLPGPLAAPDVVDLGIVLDAPPALVLDLAGADSVHARDAALLLDAGGDDLYLNNAGGSGLALGPDVALGKGQDPCLLLHVSRLDAGVRAAAAAVDLAGDDRYLGGRSCGANGGAFRGAGFLLDAAGDDTYVAGDRGANGGSDTGAGFLLDADGHDTYAGGSLGANGGCDTGVALLLDGGGDDAYAAGNVSVNGGGFGGVGALVDLGGHDAYRAGGHGANGGGEGGIGMLLDLAGDDLYEATGHGVNGEGAFGAGLLLDAGGRDTYREADASRGAGTDRSVVPKGLVGAQLDLEATPPAEAA